MTSSVFNNVIVRHKDRCCGEMLTPNDVLLDTFDLINVFCQCDVCGKKFVYKRKYKERTKNGETD